MGSETEHSANLNMVGISTNLVRLQRGSLVICGLSFAVAVSLLIAFRIHVDASSLIIALAVVAFLGGAYFVYGTWRPAPVISNLCGVLCVIAFSGAMAGIISLIGLRFGAPLIDSNLAYLDRFFDLDTPTIVHTVANSPIIAGLLGVAYESSSPLIVSIAVFLAITRRFEQLWVLAAVFATTVLFCTAISAVIPARGAFAYFDYQADLLGRLPPGAGIYHLPKFDYYRHDPSPVISFGQVQGVVTFPSFHCCLALMTIFASKGIRWLSPALLVWNVLVIVSTLPIGGHFAIDIPAGVVVWLVATLGASAIIESRAFSPIPSKRRLSYSAVGAAPSENT
jgi:hypothetical protein